MSVSLGKRCVKEMDELFYRVEDRCTYNTVDLMQESETDTLDSQALVMHRAKAIWAILSYGTKVLSICKFTWKYATPCLLAALRQSLHKCVVLCLTELLTSLSDLVSENQGWLTRKWRSLMKAGTS